MSCSLGVAVPTKQGNKPLTKLLELKSIRNHGDCPASELKEQKREAQSLQESADLDSSSFTVESLIELYLQKYIEDRRAPSGKVIPGARKRKGQIEARRTLHADVVAKLGNRAASEITRKDVVALIVGIIDRGAKVQAGNVLRELSSAYEFAIGNGKFLNTFANPALLAKASFRQTKVKLTSNKGRRVLSDDELAQFLSWLPTSAYRSKHKSILKLTLWTGCRTGEICAIKFKDIDLDSSTLHIRLTHTVFFKIAAQSCCQPYRVMVYGQSM